jgi:hypothetical protein
MPSDRQTLVAALRQAKKAGLSQEFRDGYRRYRADGDNVARACWAALYDWDMLDCEVRGSNIVLGYPITEGEK